MNWNRMKEEYGEYPEDHFDDPADYQQSIGNSYEANRIRQRRRKVEDGDIAEPEPTCKRCKYYESRFTSGFCRVLKRRVWSYEVACKYFEASE